MVIVKELFDSEYGSCSPPVLALARNSGVACLLLDFHQLHNFTHYRRTEADLFASLERTFDFAVEHQQFPKSRFGLVSEADE